MFIAEIDAKLVALRDSPSPCSGETSRPYITLLYHHLPVYMSAVLASRFVAILKTIRKIGGVSRTKHACPAHVMYTRLHEHDMHTCNSQPRLTAAGV